MRVVVFHDTYGCETGCCGHTVHLDRQAQPGQPYQEVMTPSPDAPFEFAHPYGQDPLAFAKELVAKTFGPQHVADLDWAHCLIVDD
jgi:hypothetical protein